MSSPISPELVYQLKSVGDPALSPDGRRLAYALSWVARGEGGDIETRSRITMLELGRDTQQEFTQGNKDTAPKFSPDSGLLGFLRHNGPEGRQLWVMNASGGEARQVTNSPKGVTDFGWSPASDCLVFCSDVEPQTNPEAAVPDPQVTVVSRVRYRYDTLGWRGDSHFHLFTVGAGGGEATQITDGDWDDAMPVYSPDGSRIAFVSSRRDDRDQRALSEVYVVSAGGGEPEMWSQGLYSIGAVSWSPEGHHLVAVGSNAPEGMVLWQGWLYILQEGEEPIRITDDSLRPLVSFPAINRQPDIGWTDNGRILFMGERRGESFLFQAQPDGSSVKALWGGSLQASSLTLDQNAKQAVASASSPGSPADLYLIETESGTSRQLSKHNAGFIREHPAARLEKFNFKRAGFTVECRLLFPPDFNESKKYPLVLDIHGGPNGAFYDSFVPAQQVLATSGKLVLAVNPRGSSTYGNEFMLAVLEDWGGEDYRDLMDAVDQVCERPYVDKDHLGVHGYSYGGYMTGWIVGHTDRFRAAVVGAPCMNLFSMYGTSDIGISFGEPQWGGSLVDAAAQMLEHSPITYVSNVNAPVLLLHGEEDARCPIGQSEEYFTILKRLGKEVEFVRFPGCSHQFPRLGHPRMREEYLTRTLNWFDRFLN